MRIRLMLFLVLHALTTWGWQLLFAMGSVVMLLEVYNIDFLLEIIISILMTSQLVLESFITIRVVFYLLEVTASLLLILMTHNKWGVFLVPTTFPLFRRMLAQTTGVILISCLINWGIILLFLLFIAPPVHTNIRLFIIDRCGAWVSRARRLLVLLVLFLYQLSLVVYCSILLVVNNQVASRATRAWPHNFGIVGLLLVDEHIANFPFVFAHHLSGVVCQEYVIVTSIYVHRICTCSVLAWPLL